jgi:hypothetical protein
VLRTTDVWESEADPWKEAPRVSRAPIVRELDKRLALVRDQQSAS